MIEVISRVINQIKGDNMSFFEGLGYTVEAFGQFIEFIPKAISYLVEIMV